MAQVAGCNRVWTESRLAWNLDLSIRFLHTPLPHPPFSASLLLCSFCSFVNIGQLPGPKCHLGAHLSFPLVISISEDACFYLRSKWFPFPFSCKKQSYHWESNLLHELICHHYLQHKFWNQSGPGNFIDAQSRVEPRSPWICCADLASLTTNMSLTKLPWKDDLVSFVREVTCQWQRWDIFVLITQC